MDESRTDTGRTDTDRRRVLGLGAAAAAVACRGAETAHIKDPDHPVVLPAGHRVTDHMRAAYARMRF